ncbi:MAG: FliO/MopB family protein [Bacteriovoracia bacterium]
MMQSKLSGFFLAGLGLVAAACLPSEASATTVLKQVQSGKGEQIVLQFDQPISMAQVGIEYVRDIIQLSLKDVSVYPAKILAVDSGEITKIFTYQYTPKLVRCRLSVKESAEAFRNRLQLQANGKQLIVKLGPKDTKKDAIATASAQATRQAPAETAADDSPPTLDKEQKALLEKVLGAPKPAAKADGKSAAKLDLKTDSKGEKLPLTSAKPLPSPIRAFAWLGLILAMFGGAVLLLRKLKGRGSLQGRLTGMFQKGKSARKAAIEVMATHYLGPKKSIAVVRVNGKEMVLGITEDSINLISHLSALAEAVGDFDEELEPTTRATPASAHAPVQSTDRRPAATAPAAKGPALSFDAVLDPAMAQATNRVSDSVKLSSAAKSANARDRIRDRLKGMKSL